VWREENRLGPLFQWIGYWTKLHPRTICQICRMRRFFRGSKLNHYRTSAKKVLRGGSAEWMPGNWTGKFSSAAPSMCGFYIA
jgi:hypothetical protein